MSDYRTLEPSRHGTLGSHILVAALILALIAFGAVWVVTHIFAIIQIVLPAAVLAGLGAGVVIGWRLRGRMGA
jgi:hypothetical protein